MDVHPPHHPLNTWRDFFIHLATITIGLLIALALEAAAEAVHHRHIVSEARENIRHELEANERQGKENEGYVKADIDRMQANLELARRLRHTPTTLKGKAMSFTLDWSSFNQSAWLSARDSGALTYMPTAEVQHYADSYVQQEIVNRQAIEIFTIQSEAVAPLMMESDPSLMTLEEAERLTHDTAIVSIRLNLLRQLVEQLDKNYAETLRK